MSKKPTPPPHHSKTIKHRSGDGTFKAPPTGATRPSATDSDAPLTRDNNPSYPEDSEC
jgi:hypothetical protein